MKAHRVVRRRGSHIFKTICSQMAVRLSAPSAGRPLPPRRFLVPIYVRGCVDPRVIMRLEGLAQTEKSNDLIWNGTRDLPACSIVPQPITIPRAPKKWVTFGMHRERRSCINELNYICTSKRYVSAMKRHEGQ
jgi:hypothetical protein